MQILQKHLCKIWNVYWSHALERMLVEWVNSLLCIYRRQIFKVTKFGAEKNQQESAEWSQLLNQGQTRCILNENGTATNTWILAASPTHRGKNWYGYCCNLLWGFDFGGLQVFWKAYQTSSECTEVHWIYSS